MPHGRMQHIAAMPRSRSCSAYAANLFASTLKKNFSLTIFQVTKTVQLTLNNTTSKLCRIFLSDWLLQFWNSLLIICHAKNYVYNTVDSKYRRSKPLMKLTLCRSNFHAARHSVVAPLWRNNGFLHSSRNFSKSNAFSENLMKTKFILHKIFFRMSTFSNCKTSGTFNLRWENRGKPVMGGHDRF